MNLIKIITVMSSLFVGLIYITGCQTTPENPYANLRSEHIYMMQYYKKRDASTISQHIDALGRSDFLDNPENHIKVAAFYSEIFATNPDSVLPWIEQVCMIPNENRLPFFIALRWANTAQIDEFIEILSESKNVPVRTFIRQIANVKLPDLTLYPLGTQRDIDAAWFAFFASARAVYLESILYTAVKYDAYGRPPAAQYSALASLRAHADYDPYILKIKTKLEERLTLHERDILSNFFNEKVEFKSPEQFL